MMYSNLLTEIYTYKYKYALISTTSKHSLDFLKLPDRIIDGNQSLNLLVSNENIAKELFLTIDGKLSFILVDVEQKQAINLFKIAKETLINSHVFPYKPNDITLEAADQLILNYYHQNLVGKNILICGTGNISTKLAIRLAERQANIYMHGRNKKKVKQIVDTINMILPSYTERPIQTFINSNCQRKFDGVVSFVSAEKVIERNIAKMISKEGIAIDGGIGNFSEGFIAESIKRDIRVLRLDVRIGLPFLEASLFANHQAFFEEVMGEFNYCDVKIVAGGIIGSEGSVIVDKIKSPSQIIGIANGIGGVKDGATLTDNEKRDIETVEKYILQDRKTNI